VGAVVAAVSALRGKLPCHALKLRYVPRSAVKSKGLAMQSTRESFLTEYYLKRYRCCAFGHCLHAAFLLTAAAVP
jgi:hypothetical protein